MKSEIQTPHIPGLFPRFQDLFMPGKKTKKWDNALEKEAIKWLQASFPDRDYKYYYTTGILIFVINKEITYFYHFVIKMICFELMMDRTWLEGFNFGRCLASKLTEGGRDNNPYLEVDFYRRSAWDCGYIMGLDNFLFFPKGKIIALTTPDGLHIIPEFTQTIYPRIDLVNQLADEYEGYRLAGGSRAPDHWIKDSMENISEEERRMFLEIASL